MKSKKYLKIYGYKAIGKKIYHKIVSVLERPKQLPQPALEYIPIEKKLPYRKEAGNALSDGLTGWDIVIFWKQNDTGIYGRRSDMLIKYLARRSQIRKIAVFDKPITIEALREKEKNRGIIHDRLIFSETILKQWGIRDTDKVSFHTFIYSIGKGDYAKQIWRYPDENNYLEYIENQLKALGIQPYNSIFWFYPQDVNIIKVIKYFQPKLKIVDLVDDHRTWRDWPKPKMRLITNHYKEVLENADLTFANCQKVQQSFQEYFEDIKLIPNGCEFESPPELSGHQLMRFQQLKLMSGPKIGYVGNLEKGKIDVELIRYVADHRPDWNILLIGSAHANRKILDLDSYPNIHFLGIVQYPDVRIWIKEFDTAILPHLNSNKTKSMNPLKLYVYCSVGVPVVSTNIDNLDELKPFVSIADTYDEFINKIDISLKEEKRYVSNQLKCCLDNNSWDRRVDLIVEAINTKYN